jgi:hypothetical protein
MSDLIQKKMSKVEDLHKFFSDSENYHNTICKIEWSFKNLMDYSSGRIDELIDIDLDKELSLFFDWVKFDLASDTYRNKSILKELCDATWLIDEHNNIVKQNEEAKKRIEEYLSLVMKIGKWLDKNFDEEKSEAQLHNRYFLFDEIKKEEQEISTQIPKIKFPEIFREKGYELFKYLNSNYVGDDKVEKAKYSNLFHFLKYEQILLCSQDMYIQFIEKECKVKMSKILPESFKYKDKIQSILIRLKKNFDGKKMP